MSDIKVRVLGLNELARAFRRVGDEVPQALRLRLGAIANVAAGVVASKYPHLTGTAAGSVKPRASTRGAAIAFGGQAAPYAPWLDFGGRVGRGKSIARHFIKEGRYLYPTLKEMRPEIMAAVEEAVIDTAEESGFEIKG